MAYAMERLGRRGAGAQSRRKFFEEFLYLGGRAVTAAAVSGLQGLTKELVLACVRVRPEAA